MRLNAGRLLIVAILIGLIVGGIVMIARGVSHPGTWGGPMPPPHILKMPQERIDRETYELETLTLGEWMRRGERNGFYRSRRGKYTMTVAITCNSCGQRIPAPLMDPDPERPLDETEFFRSYLCPRCGKPAMDPREWGPGPEGPSEHFPPHASSPAVSPPPRSE